MPGGSARGVSLDVELDRQARLAHLLDERRRAARGPAAARASASSSRGAGRAAGASRRAPRARSPRSTPSASRAGAWLAARARVGRACAWTTITLTLWATTSCSSRAMRARSSATASRARSSRSRSSRAARSRSRATSRRCRRTSRPTRNATTNVSDVPGREPCAWKMPPTARSTAVSAASTAPPPMSPRRASQCAPTE